MASEKRCSTSYLIFGASLRHGSLNDRLASLTASVVEEKGGTVDRVQMSDFDCPSYDADVEHGTGIPRISRRASHAGDGARRDFDGAEGVTGSRPNDRFPTRLARFFLPEGGPRFPRPV